MIVGLEPRAQASFDVILFDLGGVLVELGDSPLPAEWLSQTSNFSLADWFGSATARTFEKGLISPRQFALAFIDELGIDISPQVLLEHFTQWPIGVYPGVNSLLTRLGKRYRLAVLSNSNELHWPRIQFEFGLLEFFSDHFASHQLQKLKPEPEIFRHVVAELRVKPARLLYFDDNPENVDAAACFGIRSVLIQGFDGLETYCKDHGLVDA